MGYEQMPVFSSELQKQYGQDTKTQGYISVFTNLSVPRQVSWYPDFQLSQLSQLSV